jgi:hypothetical protein
VTFHATGEAVHASARKPASLTSQEAKHAKPGTSSDWSADDPSAAILQRPSASAVAPKDVVATPSTISSETTRTRPSEPKPEATLAPPVFDASAVNLRISLGKPEDLPQIIAKCHGYLGFASPSDPDNVANLYRAPDGRKEPLRVGLISLDNYFALKIVSNPPPWIEEVRKHNRLSPAMDAYMLLPLDFRNHIVQDEILRVAGETNAHGGKITAATLVFTADSDLGFTIKDVEVQ